MRVNFTVWEDRISPVFEASRRLLIAKMKNGQVRGKIDNPVWYQICKAIISIINNHGRKGDRVKKDPKEKVVN